MEVIIPDTNWLAIAPHLILLIGALIVLLTGAFSSSIRPLLSFISFTFITVSLTMWAFCCQTSFQAFSGMITFDELTGSFGTVILFGSALIALMTHAAVDTKKNTEFYAVLLLATLGMLIMASSRHLMVIYLGLEILSIAFYILIGMNRTRVKSLEAAFKYFLLGAFASAFFLYGISLTYGSTGSMHLTQIRHFLDMHNMLGDSLMLVGLGLLLTGLAFKLALIPFHMWTPDVYEGSPAPVTAFIATVPKAAGFIVFIRIFTEALAPLYINWSDVLYGICLVTMIGGNLLALIQKDLKRMMAYSGIAHAGYLTMVILAGPLLNQPSAAGASIVFYLLIYILMNLIVFGVLYSFEKADAKNVKLDRLAGLGKTNPFFAMATTAAMLSLAGIPLTGGFIAKVQIFSLSLEAGYTWLTVIAILTVIVSVYYYLNVVVKMYFHEPDESLPVISMPLPGRIAVAICVFVIILLGVFPSLFLNF